MPTMPGPIRALRPLVVARAILLAATFLSSVSAAPRLVARFGDVLDPQGVGALRIVAAAAIVVFGVAFVAVYLVVARAALRGVRAARVLLIVASLYLLLSTASGLALAALRPPDRSVALLFELPHWVRGVFISTSALDVAVIVLLVLPSAGAWFAATRPPTRGRSSPPPWPVPGYGPPDPGRRH